MARQAKEQLHARLLPLIRVFQSKTGSIITSDAGPLLGSAILEVEVDEPTLAVKAKGVDLREMPFRDFTIEGAVDAKSGAMGLKSSIIESASPLWFRGVANGNLSGNGFVIAPFGEVDRTKVDALVTLGRKLQGAVPIELQAQVIELAAVKARQAVLQVGSLTGTVFYRGRNDARVVGLFSGNLAARKAYVWRKDEVVSIRLGEIAKGSGLYIRGGTGPTEKLLVVVNGVYRVTIDSLPKAAAAIVVLPPDLELLDIRFEAQGTVQTPGIALIW